MRRISLYLAVLIPTVFLSACQSYSLVKVNELNTQNEGDRRKDLNYGWRYDKSYCALPDNLRYKTGDRDFKAVRILGMGNWYLNIIRYPKGGFAQATSIQFKVQAPDNRVEKAWFFIIQKQDGTYCRLTHLVRCTSTEPYCTAFISEYKGGDDPALPRGPRMELDGRDFRTRVREGRQSR